MPRDLFPRRIETDRLTLERVSAASVDLHDLYAFLASDGWRAAVAEHMPWFAFDRLDQVATFVEDGDDDWAAGERARYLLRSTEADGAPVGLTAFDPEWTARRAGSDIAIAEPYRGREYAVERASVFVELAFDRYDLDAFYTTCAAGNEPSRRMIEKYVERYGGRHEGLLRQHSPRPSGEVTDQHRYTITRAEYEASTADVETLDFGVDW